jgi:hypothetical protein
MATYGGSSDVSAGYTLSLGLGLSTDVSTRSSPVEASHLKGLGYSSIYQFKGIQDLQNRVEKQSDALRDGHTTNQYLVFLGVTKDHLAQIDRQRAKTGKHTRMTHYTETDELIIKLPTEEHETAHVSFAKKVNRKLEGMGLPEDSLYGLGATKFVGSSSSKEGDSAYKPLCRPGKGQWPTLVVEAGYSETLPKLRADAEWWLINSGGDVKIVIVIWIEPASRSLLIEQWCMPLPLALRSGPVTRARSTSNANANTNTKVPVKTQELTVIQDPPIPHPPGTIPTYTVTGAPLTLEFEKLLLRAPVPPAGNVIFTAADLQAWAERYWYMLG